MQELKKIRDNIKKIMSGDEHSNDMLISIEGQVNELDKFITTNDEGKLVEISITKLSEGDNPLHPNNIDEGYTHTDVTNSKEIVDPEIGLCFYVGSFRTSRVTEIVSKNIFKTMNSIYQWKVNEDYVETN